MSNEQEYAEIGGRADDLAAAGRKDEADALLQKGLTLAMERREEAYALFFEGELAGLRGDFRALLDRHQRATQLAPHSTLILRNLGAALGLLDKHTEAIEWFDRALALKPNDYEALGARGVALGRLGKYAEAIKWFDRALALKPDDYHALRARAVALGYLNKRTEAIEWFDKALAVKPDDHHALRERGVALGRLGRKAEALQSLRDALALRPDDTVARYWLGVFSPKPEQVAREIEEGEARRQTELRQANAEAQERKIKLNAWRSLSARSAHKIGNQVFSALGSLRSIKKADDGRMQEDIQDLESCLTSVRRTMQEFQTFSAKTDARLAPVDIMPILERSVRKCAAQQDRISLVLADCKDLPACNLDAAQFEQAIGELLENAVHHTPTDGTIMVWAEKARGRNGPTGVTVVVENTGAGVPAENKERIFEPFFTTRAGGAGLGLAIVRQLVEDQGGRIRENGVPGKNARFVIVLPLSPTQEKPQ
jgi:signal transduction histidine kinase